MAGYNYGMTIDYEKQCCINPKFHLARHVTSLHDTTRRACRARRDESVTPCCPTSATCLVTSRSFSSRHVTTFPYAKMHGPYSVLRCNVTRRAKWNLDSTA